MSNLDQEIQQVSMMKEFEEDQKRNMTKKNNDKPFESKKTQKTEPLKE